MIQMWCAAVLPAPEPLVDRQLFTLGAQWSTRKESCGDIGTRHNAVRQQAAGGAVATNYSNTTRVVYAHACSAFECARVRICVRGCSFGICLQDDVLARVAHLEETFFGRNLDLDRSRRPCWSLAVPPSFLHWHRSSKHRLHIAPSGTYGWQHAAHTLHRPPCAVALHASGQRAA